MDSVLPSEIITCIFQYLSLKDLVRTERTCKLLQSYSLTEIEKRVQRSESDEWGIQIHLEKVKPQSVRFDPVSKKAYYSILMDPVKIKSMFDRKRPIHCSLLRKNSQDQHEFIITVQKGMTEGKRIELNVENDLCKVKADLVRLPTPPKYVHPHLKVDSITSLAPSPFTYTLQITELSLPLSTIA